MKKVKNPWSFENFRKGPLTSIVGAGLMAAGIYIFMQVEDGENFAYTLLGLGALAFGLKDPKKPGTGAAAIIALLLLLTSCVTYKKCEDKFGYLQKPSKVLYEDTLKLFVVNEADSVEGDINLDTLCSQWAQIKILKALQASSYDSSLYVTDTTSVISASGKISMQYWIDKYNNLLRFKSKEEPDTVFIEKIIRDSVECPPQMVFDPDKTLPWHRWVWERYKSLSAWALLFLIAAIIMYYKWKKIKGFKPEQHED